MCVPDTPMSRCNTERISSPPDFLSVSSATSYSLRTSGGIASTLSYSLPLKTIFRLTAPGLTTELRRIGATRRSGLEYEPRKREDPGLDAELSDVSIEHARGSEQRASERPHRHGEPRAETKGPHAPQDRTERALDAEAGVDAVLDQGHERRDRQRPLRTRGRCAPSDPGARDDCSGPHGPVPSPAAGDTSNTVAAIRSAFRPRTLAFAESRSARRRAFAATFSGITPWCRCTRNATIPVTAAVAATTSAPPRSPPPRSPLAAPAISRAAAATPSPLATSRRAASGDIRSGSSARRSRSGSVSSSGATSCRRSKYTRAESDVPVSRLRPATASA